MGTLGIGIILFFIMIEISTGLNDLHNDLRDLITAIYSTKDN